MPGVGLGQGGSSLVPQALDVQGTARADVRHALGHLRRAGAGVGAAQVDVALLGRGQRGAARGTGRRHDEDPFGAVTGLDHRPDDLGDDVASLAQDHKVTDAHALARDLLGVVERRPGHRRPGDENRLHDAKGRDSSGSPHLHVDVEQARVHLLRRVLVGGGPARHARGVSEPALLIARVDLEHDPVDLVDQVVAVLGVALDIGLPLGAADDEGVVGRDRQAPPGQELVPLVLESRQLLTRSRGVGPDAVGDKGQRPRGGDGRVLLPQGACGSVTRVGEDLEHGLLAHALAATLLLQGAVARLAAGVVLLALTVEARKGLDREVDLAAHLDEAGDLVAAEPVGHAGDGADVGGDVLTRGPVPAGGRPRQNAVGVGQGHCQAVNLDLGGHGQARVCHAQVRAHALSPLLDLLQAEDVLQGVHALGVGHRREGLRPASAHATGGRVGHAQLRPGCLQVLQLAVQRVIGGVRGRRLGVERVIVGGSCSLNELGQLLPAASGFLRHGLRVVPGAVRGGGGGLGTHRPIFPHGQAHRVRPRAR